MPARVVSFINLKGGVGKTTLALAIGEWLAFGGGGQKVLLVDVDPQYNMSSALLPVAKVTELGNQGKSVYHMFKSALVGTNWDIGQAIVKDCSNIYGNINLHTIVSGPDLGRLDEDILECWLTGAPKPAIELHTVLGSHIQRIKEQYSWIIIDCPPSLSIVTSNAILCNDYWIAPLIPEALSVFGVEMITTKIASLEEVTKARLPIKFGGSILNRIDISRKDHQKRAFQIYNKPARYQPFDSWIGDWKPLYIVSDYDYPGEALSYPEWPSVREKYGGEHSWAENKADTPEKALLQSKLGLGGSYRIANVVLNLAMEFKRTCI